MASILVIIQIMGDGKSVYCKKRRSLHKRSGWISSHESPFS